jgi:c(7)-type cytochrome triheme protein
MLRHVIHKAVVVSLTLVISFAAVAVAVPPGKKLEFNGNGKGAVAFDGRLHAEHGKYCALCHTDLFHQKKGDAKITVSDHREGKRFCFACHNGAAAYAPEGNCARCHHKGEVSKSTP